MEFRQFLEREEMMSESVLSNLAKGLLAGAVSLSPLMAAAQEPKANPPGVPQPDRVFMNTPRYKQMASDLKDEGRFYSSYSTRVLIKMAEEGDEWAMRELPWPSNHKFHKLGRPYFRNDGPHPTGAFPPKPKKASEPSSQGK